MTMSSAAVRPALSVMLIVSDGDAAVRWYTTALGAGRLWDLGGVAGLDLGGEARPLTSHEVVVETIRATTTKTGLTVNAELDLGTYQKGIKISDQQMKDLETSQLHRHEFHGDWNYTMHPARADTATRPNQTHLDQA